MSNNEKAKFLERCKILDEVLLLKDILVKDKSLYTDLEFEELIETMYDDTITLNTIEETYKNRQEDYLLGASLKQIGLKDRIEIFKKNLKNILPINKPVLEKEPFKPLFKGNISFCFKSHEELKLSKPSYAVGFDGYHDGLFRKWELNEKIKETISYRLLNYMIRTNHMIEAIEHFDLKWIEIIDQNKIKKITVNDTSKRRLFIWIDNNWMEACFIQE